MKQPKSSEGAWRQFNAEYRRLGYGGMFGWDWRTLYAANRDAYYTLRGLLHLVDVLPTRRV